MEKLTNTPRALLRMGEMSVAKKGELLRTLLGSCLGLALYDRRNKIGGLAHIVLPAAPGNTDRHGKYVDTAIPKLVQEMAQLTNNELRLTAKIAGGACMFSNSIAANIGEKNVEACELVLNRMQIPLVGKSCGGKQGRRMSLNTNDGSVMIEIVGKEETRL